MVEPKPNPTPTTNPKPMETNTKLPKNHNLPTKLKPNTTQTTTPKNLSKPKNQPKTRIRQNIKDDLIQYVDNSHKLKKMGNNKRLYYEFKAGWLKFMLFPLIFSPV